jgi:hypothetical protein
MEDCCIDSATTDKDVLASTSCEDVIPGAAN